MLRLSLAGLVLLSFCPVGAGEPLPARAEVLVSITPGKPGASTEEVKAHWDGKQSTLEVKRGPSAEPVKADLPEAEFRKLWGLVVRNELRSFEAEKKPGEVFDFGERRLEIGAAQTADASMTWHKAAWDAPLTNESKVEPLIKEMGRLAAQYAKRVELYYFPTTRE